MWFIETPVYNSATIETVTACSRRAVLNLNGVPTPLPSVFDSRQVQSVSIKPGTVWEYALSIRKLPCVDIVAPEKDTIQVQSRKRSSADAQVYTFSTEEDVKREIIARGPVMTAIHVSRHFLDFWNKLLETGVDPVYDYEQQEKGHKLKEKHTRVVTLCIVGWDADAWIVASDWSPFKLQGVDTWGSNGFFKLRNAASSSIVSNATAVLPLTTFESSKANLGIVVWVVSPPSKRPIVKVNAKVSVQHGENALLQSSKFSKWLDAENIMGTFVLASILICLVVIVCVHIVRTLKDAEK